MRMQESVCATSVPSAAPSTPSPMFMMKIQLNITSKTHESTLMNAGIFISPEHLSMAPETLRAIMIGRAAQKMKK